MATAQELKDALASWASGVSVVATRTGGLVYGLTVSSFTSLSIDPPLVLVCVGNRNRLSAMIREAGRFAISLLSADQDFASAQFARAGREPSASFGVPEEQTASGMPAVADASAYLACDLHDTLLVGDHTIVVGRVTEAVARADREPLLYHRRRYRTLGAVG